MATRSLRRSRTPGALTSVGQRVAVTDQPGMVGVVEFVGKVKFGAGDWVGLNLGQPVGKHNGTVKGVKYFLCPERHGIFVRPEKLIDAEEARASPTASLTAEADRMSAEESVRPLRTSSPTRVRFGDIGEDGCRRGSRAESARTGVSHEASAASLPAMPTRSDGAQPSSWDADLRTVVSAEVRKATQEILGEVRRIRTDMAALAASAVPLPRPPRIGNVLGRVVAEAVSEEIADVSRRLEDIRGRLSAEASARCSSGGAGAALPQADPFNPVAPPPPEELVLNHLGHEQRGVSVNYLATSLLDEVRYVGLDSDAKVHEIETDVIRRKGAEVICPRDGKEGAAYVDCIYGADNASLATFMLSYTWGYHVGDIVDTLLQYCEDRNLDTKRAYVWICCLCINQHRVKAKEAAGEVVPFEEFRRAFAERVAGIGKIVAMMAPWRDPVYLKRVWCNFEMYTATTIWPRETVEANVTIAMPPRESNDFRKALLSGGVGEVWKALGAVNIEAADASVPEDKARILTLIRNGPGFHNLNCAVAERLQGWIVQASEGYFLHERLTNGVDPDVSLAKLGEEVGVLLKQVGHLDRSAQALDQARDIREKTGTLQTPGGANLFRNIGVVRAEQGDDNGAMEAFVAAKAIHEQAGTLMTCDGARVWSNIGNVYILQGNTEAAGESFQEAFAIRQKTHLLTTTEGALLMMNVGTLKRSRGDVKGALEAFEAARATREETGMLGTPDGARLMCSIADAVGALGQTSDEVKAYEEARRILEITGTLETKDGCSVLTSLGAAYHKQGNSTDEIEVLELAKRIHEKTGTSTSTEGKKTVAHVSALKMAARKAKVATPRKK